MAPVAGSLVRLPVKVLPSVKNVSFWISISSIFVTSFSHLLAAAFSCTVLFSRVPESLP